MPRPAAASLRSNLITGRSAQRSTTLRRPRRCAVIGTTGGMSEHTSAPSSAQGAHALAMDDENSARIDEAEALAEMGKVVFAQTLTVSVVLPKQLAEKAVRAWRRDDMATVSSDESATDRRTRRQAGDLALIGRAIDERGVEQEDGTVSVDVDAWQVGAALDAADERNLLRSP